MQITAVKVMWLNPKSSYELSYATAENAAAIAEHGRHELEVSHGGITSFEDARRYAEHILATVNTQ